MEAVILRRKKMIKDLHENEFGCMEGIFYSDILGYDVKVWTVKSFNKKNNPFIEIYVTFKLPHLRKVQTI